MPNIYDNKSLNGEGLATFAGLVKNALSTKQNTLSAGSNITISNGVISATDTTYTAGTGISISNGVISATGGSGGGNIFTFEFPETASG